MTGESANLIPDQLRIIRSDIKDVRDPVENIDIQVQGLNFLVTTAIGALVGGMKEVKRRLPVLESRTSQ